MYPDPALKVGDPLDPQVDQGALISHRHLDRIRCYIDLARQEGGRVLCGGGVPSAAQLGERCKAGAFLEPAVIVDLELAKVMRLLAGRNVRIELTPAALSRGASSGLNSR